MRTLAKAKGRRGGEIERFARIPEDVMLSEALTTAPHAAFRVLAILVMGKPKERNGLMACTHSHALKFGITGKDTAMTCLKLLQERGLIVMTRKGLKMRKIPTLYAVTWWPIKYRDGQPLDNEEAATHAYAEWTTKIIHPDHRGTVTPTIGVEHPSFHPDSQGHSPTFHPDPRGYSRVWGVDSENPASPTSGKRSSQRGRSDQKKAAPQKNAVHRLMKMHDHLPDADIAKLCNAPIELVAEVRRSLP